MLHVVQRAQAVIQGHIQHTVTRPAARNELVKLTTAFTYSKEGNRMYGESTWGLFAVEEVRIDAA